MRRIIYLVLIAGAIWLGFRYYQSRQEWHAYSSPEGRFAAEFPEQPQEELKTVKTRDGPVEMHVVHATRGRRDYAVGYCPYGGDWEDVPAEKRMQSIALRAFESGVKFRSSRAIKSGDVEGVEIRFQLPNELDVITARCFVRGGRLYMVMVNTPQFDLWPEDNDRFFDSFKLQ